MITSSRGRWLAVLALAASAVPTAAQSVPVTVPEPPNGSTYESFGVAAPSISDRIVIQSSMDDGPAGAYRITDVRDPRSERTWQIEGCQSARPTAELRRQMGVDVYVRCYVTEITRELCESCASRAVSFDQVVFGRWSTRVRDPRDDYWFATISAGVRRVRLFIGETRFVVQDFGTTDPNLIVVEAPLDRRR